MRCIAYFSEVVWQGDIKKLVPIAMSRIHRQAKENNSQNDITGILSYKNGHYFQIFEGESRVVQNLFDKIKEDLRHVNVVKFIDIETKQRFFPESPMKLVTSLGHDSGFRRFYQSFERDFQGVAIDNRAVLMDFVRETRQQALNKPELSGKSVFLTQWPNFSTITPTASVIELCAYLTTAERRYDQLVADSHFGDSAQIDELIQQFDTMGILKVRGQPKPLEQPYGERLRATTESRFFDKMRLFLRL